MPFTPINTQEEFDQRIQERIERERRNIESKYSDYDSLKKENTDLKKENTDLKKQSDDLKQKHSDAEKQISDLQNKVKGYELEALKTNIAQETGIPFALRGRLQGTTEEEIRKDAETLAGLIGENKEQKPIKPPAPAPKLNDGGNGADPYAEMVKNLNFGG